jgi:hypothetical protein
MPGVVSAFARRRTARRAWYRTTGNVARPLVQFIMTLAGAFAAAAWTATHPASPASGSTGPVSWPSVVLAAVVGGALVFVLTYAAWFLYELARYRVSGWRDGEWEASVDTSQAPTSVWMRLLCRTDPPGPIPRHLEVGVKVPSGYVYRVDPALSAMRNVTGCYFELAPHVDLDPGSYEARWYAPTDRNKRTRSPRSTSTSQSTPRLNPAPARTADARTCPMALLTAATHAGRPPTVCDTANRLRGQALPQPARDRSRRSRRNLLSLLLAEATAQVRVVFATSASASGGDARIARCRALARAASG